MMKGLLSHELAPVTFSWGFVEAPFQQYCQKLIAWWKHISIEFETAPVYEDLRSALHRLEPLQTPQNRYLVVETNSPWTAIFSNGLKGADVAGPVGHLCQELNCRGLAVSCIPDRSYIEDKKDAIRIYGAVSFTLFGPRKTDWLNRVRKVSAVNDGGTWLFVDEGSKQPYENLETYKKRKVAERFTCEMLSAYCEALDIKLFDSGFYGPNGLLVHQLTKFPQTSPQMSISEAHAHLYLSTNENGLLTR
jgi:hypothetical protein